MNQSDGGVAISLVILALATWRMASLFATEEGPFEVFLKLRMRLGMRFDERSQPVVPTFGQFVDRRGLPSNEASLIQYNLLKGLCCVWCNSMWIGFGIIVLWLLWPSVAIGLCLPPALSAAAVLIERRARG